MKKLTFDELTRALRDSGLGPGDLVFVQSRLFTLGPVEGISSRQEYLEFYKNAIFEVIGEEGTLAVLTAFEDYGRHETPFVLESSPSRSGMFSEYIRTKPGAVRSKHPLFSITAIGKKAQELCGGEQPDAFGYGSSWHRLHTMNAKMLFLGVDFKGAFTFGHYIEQSFGVPYAYVKLFCGECRVEGRRIETPFTANVRYLDYGIVYDFGRFEEHLLREKKVVRTRVGLGYFFLMNCQAVFEEGIKCLRQDRYYFLLAPPVFEKGRQPMDGPTGRMLTPEEIMARAGKA